MRRLTALEGRGWERAAQSSCLPCCLRWEEEENMEPWSCAPSQRTHTVGQTAAQARAGCCNDHGASRVTHLSGAMNNTLTLTHGRLWSHGLACKRICWYRQIVLFSLCSIFPCGNTLLCRTQAGRKDVTDTESSPKPEIKSCFNRVVLSCYSPTEFHFFSIFNELELILWLSKGRNSLRSLLICGGPAKYRYFVGADVTSLSCTWCCW